MPTSDIDAGRRALLDAAPGLKYKAALSVAYGAGLRAAEVVALKVCDRACGPGTAKPTL